MLDNTVAVINIHGRKIMPTNPRKARRFLDAGKAEILSYKPFTIRMLVGTPGHTQPLHLGIDGGYAQVGFSVVSAAKEVAGGELTLLTGMSERLTERARYRRNRRSRLRYREPRFDNRRRPEGWLAPSIEHKLDSTVRFIRGIVAVMPVTGVTLEMAQFDIQKILDPEISGVGYQQGPQEGFWNLREYILHRDGHRCRHPACPARKHEGEAPGGVGKKKATKFGTVPLQVHHIGYWRGDRSDRPGNLITLCTRCHQPRHHKEGGMLWGWQPAVAPFRAATFMTTVRRMMVERLRGDAALAGIEVSETFGYATKSARIALKLDKSHHTDAFVIAGGRHQKRAPASRLEQVRRNNRSLEQVYDAVYHDLRPAAERAEAGAVAVKKTKAGRELPVAGGQDLSSGRRRRSLDHDDNGPCLRRFRGHKLSAGRRAIRRNRHALQPGDRVLSEGRRFTVLGSHCKGSRAILRETRKSVAVTKLRLLEHRAGICRVAA